MLVQSHRRYAESAEFDPETGALLVRDKGTGWQGMRGLFGLLGDVWAVLYRQGDDLSLRLGGRTLAASEIREAQHRLHQRERRCRLTVLTVDGEQFEFTYDPPTDMDYEFDPTPSVEAEDFDFGLFIANVLRNPARRLSMFQ